MLSGAMSQVWGMINGLQILVYLPLFAMEFPPLSNMMVGDLITIATFDVMPASDIIDNIKDIGQGRYSSGSSAPHLRGQAIGGWTQLVGL